MTIKDYGNINTEITMTVEALPNERTRTTIITTDKLDELEPDVIGSKTQSHGIVVSSVVSRSTKAYDERTTIYETEDTSDGELVITSTASEEPIETHPAFAESTNSFPIRLAGKGDDHEVGAVFEGTDADAKFSHFSHEAEDNLGGVESYLVPSVVCEVTKTLENTANFEFTNIYDVGKIKGPPQQINVGERTWLVIGAQYRLVDGAWQATMQYQLSGPNGWNERMYVGA